jgi:hypothetical protein
MGSNLSITNGGTVGLNSNQSTATISVSSNSFLSIYN